MVEFIKNTFPFVQYHIQSQHTIIKKKLSNIITIFVVNFIYKFEISYAERIPRIKKYYTKL